VDEEVRTVRIRVEDQRPVTRRVVLPGIVLSALIAIVVSVSSLVSGARTRCEGDDSGNESGDSPV
jgi:hypothetical protein